MHKLAGSAGMIGCHALGDRARQIENSLRACPVLESLDAELRGLDRCAQDTVTALTQYKARYVDPL
ncbi:MAG: Hpt domain-containing protein [Candidatus Protistobacter heckmanni]|nr:Hpt domain-containing protein [Candidatus Protistobacter heckmanni]